MVNAAGVLDPLTGEGIYADIWNGIAAARHIQNYISGVMSDLSDYRKEVEAALLPDLEVSHRFHEVFHLTPGLFTRLEKVTTRLRSLVCRLMRGKQTYASVMRNHFALAAIVDFISDMARVTPFLQHRSGMRYPLAPDLFFLGGRGGQRNAAQLR